MRQEHFIPRIFYVISVFFVANSFGVNHREHKETQNGFGWMNHEDLI